MMDLFKSRDENSITLFNCVSAEEIRQCLQSGHDVNEINKQGRNALLELLATGLARDSSMKIGEMIDILCEAGAEWVCKYHGGGLGYTHAVSQCMEGSSGEALEALLRNKRQFVLDNIDVFSALRNYRSPKSLWSVLVSQCGVTLKASFLSDALIYNRFGVAKALIELGCPSNGVQVICIRLF